MFCLLLVINILFSILFIFFRLVIIRLKHMLVIILVFCVCDIDPFQTFEYSQEWTALCQEILFLGTLIAIRVWCEIVIKTSKYGV